MASPLTTARQRLQLWLTSSSIAGDTELTRSTERNRRAGLSAIAGLAARGSSFVVILVTVPLTLDFLGPVRFGLWMTIASVVSLLGATDLGIGNGVLNNVSHAFGENDTMAARRFLASGFVALFGVAAVFGILFLFAYPVLPWAEIYNVTADPIASSEAGPASAAFMATFLVGMPLGLVGQVRSAYQEGFVQSAYAGLGNVMTLVLLLLAIGARASLPVLVLAIAAGPIIAAIINLAALVGIQRPWLMPRRSDVTIGALRSVVSVGLAFMVLQIAYVVGFSADRLVAAQIVGPVAVADYSVVYRLFMIPAALAGVALVPLWPAYREAIARADISWVRLTLKRSLLFTLVATIPLAVTLTLLGPAVVRVWTQGAVIPADALYPALGAFTVVLAVASALHMLLNGAQAMRFQVPTMVSMAALNIAASIYLASRIGVAGVALGSVIAVVVALIIPDLFYVPRLLRRLEHGDHRSVALKAPGRQNDV